MKGPRNFFEGCPIELMDFFHPFLKTFSGKVFRKRFSFVLLPVFLFVPLTSQATSPQLKISGNQVVIASSGCTVRLKGMDVSGMEYVPTGDGGTGHPTTVINGVTMTDYVSIITEAVQTWHANFIRFPLNQDFWFGCSNTSGTPNQTAYRDMIQAVVNYCSANNVYVALDLHWSGTSSGTSATAPCGGSGWGTSTAQQNMPDWNAVTFWSSLASAYANNPAVLFDLYNEPHDVSWSVWQNGGATGATPSQSPGLQGLLNAVRGAGANNVVVAGGLDWAYDLTGLSTNALTDPSGNGIIYAAHVYPNKGTAGASTWDPKVTVATGSHAVIVSEFGQGTNDGGSWDNSLLSWLNGSNDNSYVYSGSAWCFSSDVGPTLLTSFSGYPTTSWHGAPVSTWLYNLNQTPTPNCGGGGSTPTFTFTPTFTWTNTKTATPTSTPSYTPTATPTLTRTNTLTSTPSATSTASPTATRSNTPTATPTSTASGTPTSTVTKTSTATPTNTLANTGTATQTPTATGTKTPTATASSTSTATATNTLMNSATPTSTPSKTATSTATHTPVNTATSTPTATATNTFVNSPTPTSTPTKTTTFTPTNTPINTASSTPTATVTNTLANSATPTSTPTKTATGSMTATPSLTASFTATRTATSSPTNTFVNSATPTSTPSSTPTAVTVSASQGSNPPGNSNQLAGASNVAVQQAVLTNPSTSTVTLTGLTLSVSGTGNPADITGVTLSANGVAITTTTFTGGTAVYSFSGTLPASSSVTFTVTANFGTNANGTYNFSLTGAAGTNGQAVQFSGLPVAGATVMVAQATSTPSPTATPSFTPTSTWTAAFTSTATPVPTQTATRTPKPAITPVVFPNPVSGEGTVQLNPGLTVPSNVRVAYFTVAFRKVNDLSFQGIAQGQVLTLPLIDLQGTPLASGLYYIVVQSQQGHSILKLLVLR